MSHIKAIETRHSGYHFRSRTEARWAVFFESLGIRYQYEAEGFDLGFGEAYLPDFSLLHVKSGLWVMAEVKGVVEDRSTVWKPQRFSDKYERPVAILEGAPHMGPISFTVPSHWQPQYATFEPAESKYTPFMYWGSASEAKYSGEAASRTRDAVEAALSARFSGQAND